MNLQKLKREIEHQTRNGRLTVYIELADLIELQENTSKVLYNKKRINVSADYVTELIDKYEERNKAKSFRESLKVDASELQNKINSKEGEIYSIEERDDR